MKNLPKILMTFAAIVGIFALITFGFVWAVDNTQWFNAGAEGGFGNREGRGIPQETGSTTFPKGFANGRGEHHEEASITRGVGEIFGSLIKLTLIIGVIVLLQRGFSNLPRRKANTPATPPNLP